MPLSKAVDKMRGKPGTSVVLTVVRKDAEGPLTFTLVREEINVKSVRAKMLEPGYGYVRVRQFQDRTAEDLAKALKDFYKQGDLKGLVPDLRREPGVFSTRRSRCPRRSCRRTPSWSTRTAGRRTPACACRHARKTTRAAARTTSRICRPGSRRSRSSCWSTAARPRLPRSSPARAGPQARHRARRPDFGKGSVQTILPLGNNAGLKLTTARYYTPSGRSIQAKGIEPDSAVDDGRASPLVKEANLQGHLEGQTADVAKARALEAVKSLDKSVPSKVADKSAAEPVTLFRVRCRV
jgi:carboxyl-terminal processing protease